MNFTQELKAGLARMDLPYNLEHGGKHDKLLLDVNGKTVKYALPKSPSDHRAVKNCLSDIRRVTGWKPNPVEHIKISRTI